MMGRGPLWGTKGAYSIEAEQAYYTASSEDRRAVPYAQLDRYIRGSVGLEFFRGKSVLDLGCGEGVYSAWIADRGGAARVLGVELTGHRIRWDYQDSLRNLRFEVGNLLEREPTGEKFDVVFFNLVLHHVRFALPRVAEIVAGSLKPGGAFLAFEPNVYSPVAVLLHLIHSRSANEGFLSPRSIGRALEASGLDGVRVGYFWRDRAWARNPLLASSFWITAEKPGPVAGNPK